MEFHVVVLEQAPAAVATNLFCERIWSNVFDLHFGSQVLVTVESVKCARMDQHLDLPPQRHDVGVKSPQQFFVLLVDETDHQISLAPLDQDKLLCREFQRTAVAQERGEPNLSEGAWVAEDNAQSLFIVGAFRAEVIVQKKRCPSAVGR